MRHPKPCTIGPALPVPLPVHLPSPVEVMCVGVRVCAPFPTGPRTGAKVSAGPEVEGRRGGARAPGCGGDGLPSWYARTRASRALGCVCVCTAARGRLFHFSSTPTPYCDVPSGMKIMPESERLDTLRVLQESLEETNKLIGRLPLKIETMGQIRRKTELEAKLKELEDAIAIFSRDVVFIADDE